MTTRGFWGRNLQSDNRRLTLGNSFGAVNRVLYVCPQGGGPSLGLATTNVFSSMEDAFNNLQDRDIIFVMGVVREQLVAPEVYDVTIVGVGGVPRQATEGGVPTGGGATWMPPATGATVTPLLEIVRQGWSIQNIAFNPPTSAAAIRLTTAADPVAAGQFYCGGCTFLGGGTGQIGIEDNGGSGFVVIEDNIFQLLTGTAILGLNTAIAIPLSWRITGNVFRQNTNDIKMSLSQALIEGNTFMAAGSGSTNKVISTIAVSGQGNNNTVGINVFKNIAAEIKNNNGYNGGSTDTWLNYAEGTAALIIESPPGAS